MFQSTPGYEAGRFVYAPLRADGHRTVSIHARL